MERIDAITGIIPANPNGYQDRHYSFLSVVRQPIDHYAICKGDPKSKSNRPYHMMHVPAVGSLYRKESIFTVTYSGIDLENIVHHPGDYERVHTIRIDPLFNVTIDNIWIAQAPALKPGKNGKDTRITPAGRLKICKGIVWFLMNDDTCLKDKLAEIGILDIIPAVLPAEKVSEEFPEDICLLYPIPSINPMEESVFDAEESMIRADIEEMKEDTRYPQYDELNQEYNEPATVILAAFQEPEIIRRWQSGRCLIMEVVPV